jgi:hypothetical protein
MATHSLMTRNFRARCVAHESQFYGLLRESYFLEIKALQPFNVAVVVRNIEEAEGKS